MGKVTWRIEQHTLAKHELLREYLRAWFPILALGSRNRRVVFLDGFAGPGVYVGGQPGSPLIALEVLVEHTSFASLADTEFVFIFVEADKKSFRSLEYSIDRFWNQREEGQPDNISVYLYNSKFTDVAEQILLSIGDDAQLAPTLAFIDPFGWSGVPLSVIAKLLSSDKCEVLFNFMYDSVNRFVADTRPAIASHFAQLFGIDDDEHHNAGRLEGDDRKTFLRELYIRQLKTVGNFKYVRAFEFSDIGRGRTAYFLMYGTRSIKGLEVIKDAMWNIDPVTGVRFTGLAGDQMMLFDPKPDLGPLRRALLSQFKERTAHVELVRRYVLEQTDYKKSHCTQALRELEDQELIRCTQRRRRRTYPVGTLITFLPQNESRLFPLDE